MTNAYPLPPVSAIIAVSSGDTEAIYTILQHYESYIVRLSTRPLVDSAGNTYYLVDEEMRNRLQIRLITRTLAFRLDYNKSNGQYSAANI